MCEFALKQTQWLEVRCSDKRGPCHNRGCPDPRVWETWWNKPWTPLIRHWTDCEPDALFCTMPGLTFPGPLCSVVEQCYLRVEPNMQIAFILKICFLSVLNHIGLLAVYTRYRYRIPNTIGYVLVMYWRFLTYIYGHIALLTLSDQIGISTIHGGKLHVSSPYMLICWCQIFCWSANHIWSYAVGLLTIYGHILQGS